MGSAKHLRVDLGPGKRPLQQVGVGDKDPRVLTRLVIRGICLRAVDIEQDHKVRVVEVRDLADEDVAEKV